MRREPGIEQAVVVVVVRHVPDVEVLLLHRAIFGPETSDDWAWTTPGGRREPGEQPLAAATRELVEETGLRLTCKHIDSQVAAGRREAEIDVFFAEAPADVNVTLSAEHDRVEWVSLAEIDRCRPVWVQELYREVLARCLTP